MYLFHIITVPHISPFIYHCQALLRSNTSAWCCYISLPKNFCRNTILIILTLFSLNASFAKFHFPTLCTFYWIVSHFLTFYEITPKDLSYQKRVYCKLSKSSPLTLIKAKIKAGNNPTLRALWDTKGMDSQA